MCWQRHARRLALPKLLQSECHLPYFHILDLAPAADLLSAYKDGLVPWEQYADRYLSSLRARDVAGWLSPEMLDGACLLCACQDAARCHRRLAAEHLAAAVAAHPDWTASVEHLT